MCIIVPRLYLSPPDIRPRDHVSLAEALNSNWVAPIGPHLDAFEAAVATRTGAKHAVALNSGTAALHLALDLLGVGPGDQVICPSFTFVASANPICYLGAEPVFVDSEPQTWNIDPQQLELALKSETSVKAVIVVHLYGQCAQMDTILELCQRYRVALIEDAAEALGASYKGRAAGSMGAFSFFSFNGNKIITTSAGGMLLTNSQTWAQRARYLASQAREPVLHYEHLAVGYNYRMSNLLAGLGLTQLTDLERRIQVRRAHFEAYTAAFSHLKGLSMMPLIDADAANYWLTCITIDPDQFGADRDFIIAALAAADIEARPLWKPLHLQPVFATRTFYGTICAEKLFECGLCLPSGSAMVDCDRDRVIAVVAACFQRQSAH